MRTALSTRLRDAETLRNSLDRDITPKTPSLSSSALAGPPSTSDHLHLTKPVRRGLMTFCAGSGSRAIRPTNLVRRGCGYVEDRFREGSRRTYPFGGPGASAGRETSPGMRGGRTRIARRHPHTKF